MSSTTSGGGQMTPVNVGQILAGRYEVEHVLGSGGMGVVVAAKHIHLGERVAIKFLLPQAMKKAEVVQRFLREGRAACRIKSEHVARVFDVGTLDDGAPYMVMEYLEGADLSTLLKTKGAVPIELAVEYVLQASEAIAEAHSLGIIHRDLKPANLFVAKRADGSPVVKVIDFGISKVSDATSEGDVEMTKTDVMMGSPVYMAPEQMISARDVDERADVWSLGIILYYLIMGAQPFKGGSVTQLYASILEGPPRMRPSRPDVPEALEKAIMKCLEAVPKERWSNVAELAMAIADFVPSHARVSVDRVARTLGVTAPIHKSAPPPPTAGSITPPAVASTGMRESTDAATGPHTDGSWGHTQGPVQRNKARTMLLAVGALVVVGVIGTGVVMLLRPSANSGAAPDASHGAAASGSPMAGGLTVVTPVVPADPPVVPAPVVSAGPSASASASAAVSVTIAKPPVTVIGPGPRVPGTTTKPVSTKPKGDLFSDPH